MTQPTILVTGATGNTGGAVVSELLHRGVPVRAMVRTRDPRSAALQARGAEVVVADIFDPDQLAAAMRGVQRAYYVPPYHPYVIQSAVAFAAAAREAVFLSQANAIKTLEAGVTTVRDLTGFDGADIAMRDLINMGAMVGPRMFVSGPGLRNWLSDGRVYWILRGKRPKRPRPCSMPAPTG